MINWFLSPIGMIIAGVIALTAAGGGLYLKARSDGNAACVARNAAQTKKAIDYVTKLRQRIVRGSSDVPDSELLNDDGYRRD